MGSQSTKYSDEQRGAIVAAVLDQGLSARESTLKAAAGELDPPPFDMPVSTAQAIVTDAKNRGRVADNRDRLHHLVSEVLTVVEQGTTRLLERAKAGTLNSRDITLGRRLTQMATHAVYLNNALSRQPTPDPDPSPDEASRNLTRMLADLQGREEETRGAEAPSAQDPQPSERDQLLEELRAAAANGAEH